MKQWIFIFVGIILGGIIYFNVPNSAIKESIVMFFVYFGSIKFIEFLYDTAIFFHRLKKRNNRLATREDYVKNDRAQ